jgi:chromosome partitioning protein
MFITVASYKGGVGKTTTAVHLAAYLQTLAPALLIDGDLNRSATAWAKRGGFPFRIADEKEGAYQARNYQHIVIDTEARPGNADFEALAKGCDLLVVPTVPASLDIDVLILTLDTARKLALDKYRVLLTKVPPARSCQCLLHLSRTQFGAPHSRLFAASHGVVAVPPPDQRGLWLDA